MKNSKLCGFTLLELLVVMSIAAILAVVAIPSLSNMQNIGMTKGLARDMVSAINFARGEALTRSKYVAMCPSADGATCDTTGADWSNGWIIFLDDGSGSYRDGIYQAGVDTELLQVYEYRGRAQLGVTDPDASGTDQLPSLGWSARGFYAAPISATPTRADTRALLVVCDPESEAIYRRGASIESSGRVMTTSDTDGNGVHDVQFADGTRRDLVCS